jgi:ATP-binding cassette subfamily B protein
MNMLTQGDLVPLFREMVKKGKGWLPLVAACSILGMLVSLALPIALGSAIDTMVSGGDSRSPIMICVALVAVAVLTGLVDSYAGTACVVGTAAWLRIRLIEHLLWLSPQRMRQFSTGDLVNRVSANAVDAAQAPTSALAASTAMLAPLGSLVLLALIDLWTALAFLAGVSLVVLVLRAFTRQTSTVAASYQEAQGAIAARLTEALDGIRTIAASGTARQEETRVLQTLPTLSAQGRRMWQVLGRSSAQAAVAGPVVLVAVLAAGGLGLAKGTVTPGELFAASRYAVMGAGLGGLTGVLGVFSRARAAGNRVTELLAQPATQYGAKRPAPAGLLEFRAVSVQDLLHQVDLSIPAGTCAAVVGKSGSGKSVLAELAARLRDPDTGSVTLDGVALPEFTRHDLRVSIGCAFERPQLVGKTIGDAIGLGRPAATVRHAAQTVQADSFIVRLPQGYETPLAEAPMSGGERQRLGLARAWPARSLLVLDDATSSLDMVTELKISQALLDDQKRRTRLIITHRVSTAASADLVVWLENGRVRAVGPHDLLWQDPAYRAVLT